MPKTTKPRVHHVDNTAYRRQSGCLASQKDRKRAGHKQVPRSSDDDGTSGLCASVSRKNLVSSSNAGALGCDKRCRTSAGASLPGSRSPKEARAVTKTADKISTPAPTISSYCGNPNPTTPCSSEFSTIVDSPGNSIFAGVSRTARLEEFEFEFESVVQIDGGQCQVRWTDSIVRDSDLHSRHLHDEPLIGYMASAVPHGSGLSKVTWKPTWEPVDILRGYEDVVRRDLQFEYGNVIKEQDGKSLVRWENSVIHESTLGAMHGHPLLNHMQSLSHPLAYGYCVAAWRPMWIPSDVMEAYGGGD